MTEKEATHNINELGVERLKELTKRYEWFGAAQRALARTNKKSGVKQSYLLNNLFGGYNPSVCKPIEENEFLTFMSESTPELPKAESDGTPAGGGDMTDETPEIAHEETELPKAESDDTPADGGDMTDEAPEIAHEEMELPKAESDDTTAGGGDMTDEAPEIAHEETELPKAESDDTTAGGGDMTDEAPEAAASENRGMLSDIDEIIDSFMRNGGEHKIAVTENTPDLNINDFSDSQNFDDDIISEELAEIYKKQGLHKEAVEIYRKLILLNPKKSVYFAEIIEEIEKNINN